MPIPEFAPRVLGQIICSGCSKPMRTAINSNNKGRLTTVEATCDNCKYCGDVELPFASIQTKTYVPPPLPSPVPLPQPPIATRADEVMS